MPQMAPLNWLSLYFLFLCLFMMTIIMNYYIFMYPSKMNFELKMKKLYNWKW
uniref:ATP synthase complex subunit 8 n=1 Tax=Anthonomus rectirostris TaxID=1341944 RepID=A0A5B8ZU09_9CUCU|nr:ATP synthase subunit 8 [Anthonomus rectirostris]QED56486.1 ATP synthase subunit 8 [Anthonomus rectirostris]QED56494.1 ATP synthase subunit 8 [Anthonomus rectirostris]QEH58475.1 ATP synthase subunit 8 [Anthonomus rectirostris]